MPADQMPDRPGDLRRCKRCSRDLIQQWLEQVMIAPVDNRDVDWRAREILDRFKPAKAGANDNDVWSGRSRSHWTGYTLHIHAPVSARHDAHNEARAL